MPETAHLAPVTSPQIEVPTHLPELPVAVFDDRARSLYERCGTDWVVVWGDREHFGNIHYLCNFDPRFEEALFVLGPRGALHLIVGNEGMMYRGVVRGSAEVVLCQTFSLMGQKRDSSPRLDQVLRDIGMATGDSVAVAGWKHSEPAEAFESGDHFFPAYALAAIDLAAGAGVRADVTHHLVSPIDGLRSTNEPSSIAALEWGAARASVAVGRIVRATAPGRSELEVVARMGYAGEPLTAHPMYATGKDEVIALGSPSDKKIDLDDGVFTAVGYRGGLSCRAGLVSARNDDFIDRFAAPYFGAIVAWYEAVRPGRSTGELFQITADRLARAGLEPVLNPGHLTSTEEWLSTDIRPGASSVLSSGMALQCDVIPGPLPSDVQVNCEDGLVLADEDLRRTLADEYPDVWDRIQQRRQFMIDVLGIDIDASVLPLSNTPALYAPLFLTPESAFVAR